MKKTKIVATVGPACRIDRTLKGLIRAGVDVFRINTSHTQPEDLREWIVRIRRTAKSVGKEVGILVDLQGPRIRTGKLRGGKPVELRTGEKAVIEVGNGEGTAQCIKTTCRELPGMLKKNDRILLDNGLMELVVLKASRHLVECKVVRGGTLGENKGINLPCVKVNLPVLNPKDLASLRMAVRMKADYIALSFVRSEKDVETVKEDRKSVV